MRPWTTSYSTSSQRWADWTSPTGLVPQETSASGLLTISGAGRWRRWTGSTKPAPWPTQVSPAPTRDRQNWALHIFETWRGLQELQAGRLPDAAVALEGRFSVDEAGGVLGIIDAANVAALGRIHIHAGDQRAARQVAQICGVMLETTAPGSRRHAAWFLARQAMALGSPTDAHRWLCALGVNERLSIFPLFPHDPADDPEIVRIALASGDDELAAQVVGMTERCHRLNPSVRSLQAAATQVRGLADHATDELEAAAGLYRTASRPLALASALEDLGQARVERRRHERRHRRVRRGSGDRRRDRRVVGRGSDPTPATPPRRAQTDPGTADPTDGVVGPDPRGTPGHPAGNPGQDQPRDRGTPVHITPHGQRPPSPHFRQNGSQVPSPADHRCRRPHRKTSHELTMRRSSYAATLNRRDAVLSRWCRAVRTIAGS